MSGPGETEPGTLFLVPTPIGNFRDITLRAMDVLGAAPVLAAEDTRKALTLLHALDIAAGRLVSYYDHNEQSRTVELMRALAAGQDVALITDAGTPLVNDPGYRLVTAALAGGVRVVPLPGASAALTALIGSGLPPQPFEYIGFLPRKAAARRAAAQALAAAPATLVLFEAPHRLAETLGDLIEVLGDRDAALARNLTKPTEEFTRGRLSQILAQLPEPAGIRGEFTLVVAGAPERDTTAEEDLADRLAAALLARGLEAHAVRDILRDVTDLPRNLVYERVQAAQR